jgi:tetratricopeptide (TPR) repeat protein
MTLSRQAAGMLLAACVLLGGCVTRGPLLESASRVVELDGTPFFPQDAHQCGPSALATVLGASAVPVTPEELEPRVYLPGRRGSLQVEMQAAPRAYGRLGYRIEPELSAITAELDAHRPVLVLHNYGLPFWPRWHYAVVVGYDGPQDKVTLRSGRKRRQQLSAANFMRAWDNGGRWALVVLRPGELPAHPDKPRYLEAAAAFEGVAQPKDSWLTFDAAVRQWPDEPVAWTGRGTASYREGNRAAAAADYRAALNIDGTQAAARNNLAMTLLEMGCASQAKQQIAQIEVEKLDDRLRNEVADTLRQVNAGTDSSTCAAP